MGIRIIAYLNFFWSSLGLASMIFIAAAAFAVIKIGNVDTHQALALLIGEPFKSQAWRSPQAISTYESFAGCLAIIVGGPFIAFRLLAKSRLGYWLCLLETSGVIALLSYAWLRYNEAEPHFGGLGLDDRGVRMLNAWAYTLTAAGTVIGLAILVYMLSSNTRKIYFRG